MMTERITQWIKPAGYTDEDARIKKNVKYIKDFFVYLTNLVKIQILNKFQIFGFMIVTDLEFVPSWIFGKGKDCSAISSFWPNLNHYESVRWYTLYQFGHHFQSKPSSFYPRRSRLPCLAYERPWELHRADSPPSRYHPKHHFLILHELGRLWSLHPLPLRFR